MCLCGFDFGSGRKLLVLAVVGPTAVGKTRLSLELAKDFCGEIVSADSIQIYKDMNIGTAKPTVEELGGISYHLVDFVDPAADLDFSVGMYVKIAQDMIFSIEKKGKFPIVCGGTGLYVDSLLESITFFENSHDSSVRTNLENLYNIHGADTIYKKLTEIDPETAAIVHKNNTRRVIRALEFYLVTGKKISDQVKLSKRRSTFDPIYVGLCYRNRSNLVNAINVRIDSMLQNGLVDEVKKCIEKNYSARALSAIGYKEFVPYLNGKISLHHAVERLKISTRQYAKRQMVWFKRNKNIKWFFVDDYTGFDSLYKKVKSHVREEIMVHKAKS